MPLLFTSGRLSLVVQVWDVFVPTILCKYDLVAALPISTNSIVYKWFIVNGTYVNVKLSCSEFKRLPNIT